MGNAFVCISDQTHFASPDAPITLVNCLSGSIQELHERPKVAEVMLEYPGNFVCRATSLNTGQRFAALPADEELSAAVPYVLLPMHKLHKRISTEESDFFSFITTKGGRAKTFSTQLSKLSPSVTPWHLPARLQSSSPREPSVQSVGSFLQRRCALGERAEDPRLGPGLGQLPTLTRCRSWKPNLQTITEARNSNFSPVRAMLQGISNYRELR